MLPLRIYLKENFNCDNDEIMRILREIQQKIYNNTKKNITERAQKEVLIDEEGNFDRKYTYDGLHPSALGYAKISQMRLKYLYNIY